MIYINIRTCFLNYLQKTVRNLEKLYPKNHKKKMQNPIP